MKTALESRPQAYKRITNGIRQYMNHTVGVMKLVQEAKRLEIWKEKWSSWQEYIENEFGQTVRRANQLLEVASTIDEIQTGKRFPVESGKNKEILANLNTRQVKALSGLPTEKKSEVLARAIIVSGGKSPKPSTINGVRQEVAKESSARTDRTGYPIPENLLSEWDRATDQANGWIRSFDAVHRAVMEVHGKDFAVAKINKSTLESDYVNYRQQLKQALPYAVCPTCQGKLPEKCKACNPCKEEGKGTGLGWVNKTFWVNTVPEEFKKIRAKAYGTNAS